MIGYIAVFAAAISGYAGVGVWAISASALALAALSQSEYHLLYKRARDDGHYASAQSTALQSLMHAAVASSGAYVAGVVLRLL